MLSVKLSIDDKTYDRMREMGWQQARYNNHFAFGLRAEVQNYRLDATKNVPHDITKDIRANKKEEQSGAAYSAAEQEVRGVWNRHAKRVLAGAPMPQWNPNKSLVIRGHKNLKESGVRLTEPEEGKFVALLQVQSQNCEGGCWIECPIALGTCKDWHVDLIRQMVAWEIPIAKASVVISRSKQTSQWVQESRGTEGAMESFGINGKPARPEIGTITTRTVKVRVCKECGLQVDETGLCSPDCNADAEPRTVANTFHAVYERTDVFKGDEEIA